MNDEIKLGRVGHYSYQEVCQVALIVYVDGDLVNVAGWNHAGDNFRREEVPVGISDATTGEFHLNRDCPWHR